jgi:DNA polymerase (family 10)
MTNDNIAANLKLTSQLLELHEANPFKIKAYTGAIYQIDKLAEETEAKTAYELERMGFTASMATKIVELHQTNTLQELQEWLAKTPEGLLEVLQIKGLGAKKVQTLWKELNITSIDALFEACKANNVAKIKGFGEKTQENILHEISFRESNARKLRYDKAETIAAFLLAELKKSENCQQVEVVGEFRRCLEVIETLQFVVAAVDKEALRKYINKEIAEIAYNEQESGVFVWRGAVLPFQTPLEIYFCSPENFANQLFILSANPAHLQMTVQKEGQKDKNLLQVAHSKPFASEEEIYKAVSLPFIAPELREGTNEINLAWQNKLPNLLIYKDLKGCLHNHSTYSDGKHSLEEMAKATQAMGLQYFGISDHSQTASYAGGLTPLRVQAQHAEIDKLNAGFENFRIFKGIESDILGDGSLDYEESVLQSFDFIVASVHSNLKMDEETATQRLLKAIANPYTTILGHPTGRLLLQRQGYPIDHKTIIETCAAHKVAIEINASPYRLDLDWRWINYAIHCGVLIAINPDAHDKANLADMYYGVLMGRKGGLTAQHTLNAMNLEEITAYFGKKKQYKTIS